MKGKDKKRIVQIYIPSTENNEAISFSISLNKLEELLNIAIKKKCKEINFNINQQEVDLSIEKVRSIIIQAKNQFENQMLIPKKLTKYLSEPFSFETCIPSQGIVARDEEIEKIWTCLCSEQKSNAILIGEHGVGKTTIAIEVSRQLYLKICPKELSGYTMLKIDFQKLFEILGNSYYKYKRTLEDIFKFLKENKTKVILYVDNLLHFKYEALLIKYLILSIKTLNLKLIASISLEDFNDYFLKDDHQSLIKYLNSIYIEEPDVSEIYPMLKIKIKNLQKKYGVKISEKMIRFSIFTGIYLSSSNSSNPESTLDVINFALSDAKRKKQQEVEKSNILSYYYIDFKQVKKTSQETKWIIAYHEAGHYLVAKLSPNIKSYKNAFISILPVEGTLGLTADYDDFNQLLFSKEYYIDKIASFLGGRVAETFYTNEFSSGAASDLVKANEMAEQLVLSFGLSSRESEKNKSYIGYNSLIKNFLLTDELRLQINDEITTILTQAYDRAKNIIENNIDILEEIVIKLLEDDVLMGDELEEICKQNKKI